ncbi:Variant surface glycoprotein [Trypanosoma congolense IL3000]|uniref:Variant surface glycoprotein n=1 Tax=Trypanosoma congolense (strain IL3000) TaxID=1068625 RepID=F9W7P3_TRYCI|nr:Variant surface glycoprotein [Trypanosoma congolense IL3000]
MEVLFNATTDNMDNFRGTLWDAKDFFEAHPPPTDPKNRREAHREIGQLIARGEKEIQDNRGIAVKVNEKIEAARLSVLQGLYGDGVKEVPKDEENLTKILENSSSIFKSVTSANESCGNERETGKTLFNDLFCLCVGDGDQSKNPHSPCSANFVSPQNGNGYNKGKWTQMKPGSSSQPALPVAKSIEKIMEECKKNKEENSMKKGMSELLKDFEEMIGKGDDQVKTDKSKKIFGHSGRGKGKGEVKECDGTVGSNNQGENSEKYNEKKICVDYSKHLKDNKYDIPWHNKFKNYTTIMKEAKSLEEKILKNRADLLLLKSQAWVAYSREKDDETSNLDDMNVSNLFDGARVPPSFPFPSLLLFLFMIL